MTDTDFTAAARAEAEKRWPRTGKPNAEMHPADWLDEGMASGFVLGAQWSAAQEPTDTEVQAAVTAILALTGESEETARMDDIDQAWDHARAALTAARSPEGA